MKNYPTILKGYLESSSFQKKENSSFKRADQRLLSITIFGHPLCRPHSIKIKKMENNKLLSNMAPEAMTSLLLEKAGPEPQINLN